MTGTGTVVLSLTDDHAQAGKIANNIEKHGDTEEVVGFTYPLTLMLAEEQLDGLMGKGFHGRLYNLKKKGDLWELDESFQDVLPIKIDRAYEKVHVLLSLSGNRELEFADCKVDDIVLEPQSLGGLTKTRLHLYLNPGLGPENLLLQEHQHHEIGVALTDGVRALKKNPKQRDLPLEPPETTNGSGRPANGVDDTQAFEAGTKKHLAAHKGGKPGVIDGTTAASRRRPPKKAPSRSRRA